MFYLRGETSTSILTHFQVHFFKLKPPSLVPFRTGKEIYTPLYTLHHTTVVQVASKRGRLGHATMMETAISTGDRVNVILCSNIKRGYWTRRFMSVRSLVQAAFNWFDWYADSMGKLDRKTH